MVNPALPASAFKLTSDASSPDNKAYCYVKLAISSPAVAVIIVCPDRDSQAELACMVD